ncbi:MAG: zinc metalloprotease HtpX [Actinobacteria bacterium]|nr:MAG: zinc metalloprotease HtpX [Actinomycetota bacterium]
MYEQISSNKWKSWLTMLAFVGFISLIAYVFTRATDLGPCIFIGAVVFSIAVAFGSYYYSDRLVLAISRARPVERDEFPYLYNTIEGLSIAAGLPVPKMYVIDDPAPNAFATGRDPEHSAIAVTTGMLEKLNRQELEGVIGHEMSHIQNFDIRFMTIVAVLAGTVTLMSQWLLRSFWFGGRDRRRDAGQLGIVFLVLAIVLAILSPIVAQLIKFALSRQREYLADSSGALLTRYPPGLASALRKLSSDERPLRSANQATAHMWIVNPLLEHKNRLNRLFDTHPPIEERIARLEAMGTG